MQFFPFVDTNFADPSTLSSTKSSGKNAGTNLFSAAASAVSSDTKHASFESVLRSFIEEGRTVYSGRPAGFTPLEKQSGTLSPGKTASVIKELRRRNVDEDTVSSLEEFMNSGAPITVSRLLNYIPGQGRRTEDLTEDERNALSALLSKLGFDKEAEEEMLALSDEGDLSGMWELLGKKLDELETTADISKEEFTALIKALDLSEDTSKIMQKLFGEGNELQGSGSQLKHLLAPVGQESLEREKKITFAQQQIRAAVDEMLKTAKSAEQSAPVDDLRGSRRSEQVESLMQESVLKKTGIAQIKQDRPDDETLAEEQAGQDKVGQELDSQKTEDADREKAQSLGNEKLQNFRGEKVQILHSEKSGQPDQEHNRQLQRENGQNPDRENTQRPQRETTQRFHQESEQRAQQDSKQGFERGDKHALTNNIALAKEGKNTQAKRTEKTSDGLSQLLQRIDVIGEQSASARPAAQAQNLNNLAKGFRQEIFSQVENGILQNAANGSRQLTLQLNPGDLGQLTVLLSVNQGEVSATIKADNQDSASIIREQLADLRVSLEAQGLKVKELDVQTQLRDNGFADQWNNHQEHNLMRDSQERDRLLRLHRMQRNAGEIAEQQTDALEARPHATESTGLHIVA